MKKSLLPFLTVSIMLTGCFGAGEIFEPRTYGVRNSEWTLLTPSERYAAKQAYLQEQALAEQRRTNELLLKQQRENDLRKANNYDGNNYHVHIHDNDHYQSSNKHSNQGHSSHYGTNSPQVADEQRRIHEEIQRQNSSYTQEQRAIEEAKRRSLITQRQEEEARRHREEAKRREAREKEQRDINEATRRSMETHRAEETRRRQREQEQRDIEEATRRSMETHRAEEARRRQLREQEQRDIEEATRRSMETHRAEEARRQNAAPSTNWQPNEGQLVRAGELVMELQRQLGRQPSVSEMNNKLQRSMGLSNEQSNKILDELGLR